MRVVAGLLLALALPRASQAQVPAAVPAAPASLAHALGRVVDSLVTGGALAGAEIWVDGAPTAVVSDSTGHFRLADVAPGWRTLTFWHPALDSIGVAAPQVRVELVAARETHVDLVTPSAATFHARACGVAAGEAEGVLVGVVQDAEDERPVPGATVTAAWLEWSVGRDGLRRVQRSARVNADAAGRFTMCFVPADVMIEASAVAGARASGIVDVELGARAFAVRQVRVGAAGVATVTGVVRDTLGRGVADARVLIVGTTASATTDSVGAFRIGGAPAGSGAVEVRAVGFAPSRVPVVASAARPGRVEVTLGRTQVLPTIAVVGRARPRLEITGFDERRKGSGGYFLTQDQIEQRRPFVTTDVFRTLPGMQIERMDNGTKRLVVKRGGAGAGCLPTVYVDGMVIFGGAIDLDNIVPASEVRAVEVYTSFVSVPNEFRTQNSTCGAVLVWTGRR